MAEPRRAPGPAARHLLVDVLDPARLSGPGTANHEGGTYRSWFAALYLPSALQWPAIAVMFIAGSAMLGMAIRGMPALRQSG